MALIRVNRARGSCTQLPAFNQCDMLTCNTHVYVARIGRVTNYRTFTIIFHSTNHLIISKTSNGVGFQISFVCNRSNSSPKGETFTFFLVCCIEVQYQLSSSFVATQFPPDTDITLTTKASLRLLFTQLGQAYWKAYWFCIEAWGVRTIRTKRTILYILCYVQALQFLIFRTVQILSVYTPNSRVVCLRAQSVAVRRIIIVWPTVTPSVRNPDLLVFSGPIRWVS